MDSTRAFSDWTPYEAKVALINHERLSEDLQLQRLRIRLEKKMREIEERASISNAA